MAEGWHGWGTTQSALQVGPHPQKRGKFALLLTTEGQPMVVAEFIEEGAASWTMDWLDTAFESARDVNNALLERAVEHGLLSEEEIAG